MPAVLAVHMDITSGGLGLTLWQAGTLLFQQNVPSGTLRILENFEKRQRDELTFPTAVREYIHGMLSPIWGIIKTYNVKYVVLSGMLPDGSYQRVPCKSRDIPINVQRDLQEQAEQAVATHISQ